MIEENCKNCDSADSIEKGKMFLGMIHVLWDVSDHRHLPLA